MRDRGHGTLASQESLIEGYLSTDETQTVKYEYHFAAKIEILDIEYKPESLDDVTRTCVRLKQ
jgi:hypothetical protein